MPEAEIQPQALLQALPKTRERAITAERLTEALELSPEQIPRVTEYLGELARVGLATHKGGRYWRKQKSGTLLIGTLRGTRSGHAFVIPADDRERARGDLHINDRSMGSAMHGDIVAVRLTGHGARGRSGIVEGVLRRANKTTVGRFIWLKDQCLVSPIEEKFLYEISIAPADTLGARDGDVVNVAIVRPPIAGRLPRGRIIEVLGQPDDPGIDLEIVIRKHHLPLVFPESCIAEAEATSESIAEEESAARMDFRDQITITIDGETARDFDDAVSLERLPSGHRRLGVHIADVSFYVRPGTPLDDEAFRRGTSVYFPESAIPMLPERLSNLICSLNPKVDRLTMSAVMDLDAHGKVVDYTLGPSIIRSRHRMTYTAVNEILTNPEGEAARTYSDINDMSKEMHALALVLIERREQRGAIDFELPEAELLFNDEGQIGGIVRSERNIAHRLIEEFMLLANETVARHLEQLGVPMVYRIHDEPDPSKVEQFQEVAESFGHKFSMHGPIPQRGFQHLLREAAGRPEERMLSYLMLRSMERARYDTKNEGHFGLAMKTYTHFTSPIRRYPDLVVHRVLREVLAGNGTHDGEQIMASAHRSDAGTQPPGHNGTDLGRRYAIKQARLPIFDEERETDLRRALKHAAAHSSERERAADDAERELMDWRKAEFMSTRIGDEFAGIISSIKEYGFYVELDEFFVEGLVHISTLDDDLYEYQPRKHRLVGVRTGRQFRLGDKVVIAVDRVDLVRHLVDFSVVRSDHPKQK
ncbi:MAG TPA: ribonuclease R [Blastocatellia bacterium]